MKAKNLFRALSFAQTCLIAVVTIGTMACSKPKKTDEMEQAAQKEKSAKTELSEWNDAEIVKYAKCFNDLCVKFNQTGFWWDCSQLILRAKDSSPSEYGIAKPEIISTIMSCYQDWPSNKGDLNVFEEEDAFTAVKNMKAGWNLGNTLDSTSYEAKLTADGNSYYDNFSVEDEAGWILKWGEKDASGKVTVKSFETAWGQAETTREIISYVKEAGFGAVRVPVTWAEHLDENDNVDPQWMSRVHQVVDYVNDEGLYCILNVHHDGGASGWVKAEKRAYDKYSSRYKKLWTQIAEEFKDYDERLLFESMNEVSSKIERTAESYEYINKWNQLFVDTVRATGGKNKIRNLVVMPYGGSGSNTDLAKFIMPEDSVQNHLILEVHNYDPQGFCFESAPWTKETALWDYIQGPISLRGGGFLNVDSYAKKWNVPVIIGEYAAFSKKYADYDK